MTKFKGPLYVGTHGAPGTEVNYVTVDASGTASFAGSFSVSGASSFAAALAVGTDASVTSNLTVGGTGGITGNATVSGNATVHGVIQQGAAGQRGTAVLVQRATIAANTTAGGPAEIILPSGSDVVDINIDLEAPFATTAGVTACNVEVSVAAGKTMLIVRTSASTTRYGMTSNADTFGAGALRNVTATIEAHASIVGSASVISAGQAMLTIHYIPN